MAAVGRPAARVWGGWTPLTLTTTGGILTSPATTQMAMYKAMYARSIRARVMRQPSHSCMRLRPSFSVLVDPERCPFCCGARAISAARHGSRRRPPCRAAQLGATSRLSVDSGSVQPQRQAVLLSPRQQALQLRCAVRTGAAPRRGGRPACRQGEVGPTATPGPTPATSCPGSTETGRGARAGACGRGRTARDRGCHLRSRGGSRGG